MRTSGVDPALSPWGPTRARLILLGSLCRSFPGTLLAVPRAAGVPARVYFVAFALLGAGVPLLTAAFVVSLSLP